MTNSFITFGILALTSLPAGLGLPTSQNQAIQPRDGSAWLNLPPAFRQGLNDSVTPLCQVDQLALGTENTHCNSKTWTYSCALAADKVCNLVGVDRVNPSASLKGSTASSGTCTASMTVANTPNITYDNCIAGFLKVNNTCLLPQQDPDPSKNTPNMRGWINVFPESGQVINGSLPAFTLGSNNCLNENSQDATMAGIKITLSDPNQNGMPSSTFESTYPAILNAYSVNSADGTLTAIGGGKTGGEGQRASVGAFSRSGATTYAGNINPERRRRSLKDILLT